MNKTFKKVLCTMLSLSMIAGTIVIPAVTASADAEPLVAGDTVLQEWKFDFGAEGQTAGAGWIAVDPTVNYVANSENGYGFIGTNENDYKLAGGRMDGFDQQQGQVIMLTAGGNGANDGIGSTGEDDYNNAGDKFYPVRFALKVNDDTYYRVRATVTTLDSAKPAVASLYTERKHPLFTDTTLAAGETKTVLFTVRPTPIYYQKSNPQGSIADGMVNVCVLGENSALASLEIQQVETAPVLWVLGDSTVTDGGGALPFWPLQNYTGVGTGLTKYLPSNIAMVNEGEGGLNAGDNNHFNMVKNRIKAGDYMYVEYGHNHKSDGPEGYTASLDKYYNACKAVGATLILVGPIDRHNDSQYDSSTNTWSSTLSGFSNAAKAYVDAKLQADSSDKIAFVDLNKPSLDWYTTLTASGRVNDTDVTNDIKLTNYYFQTAKGGGTDGTHPNDAGAENLAYFFYTTADDTAYPALTPLLANFKTGATHENPTPVSNDVINLGYAPNNSWPTYVPAVAFEHPIVIKKVKQTTDEGSGVVSTTLTAYVQANFANYASGVLEVYDADGKLAHKYVTTDHVDNTTGTGTNVLHFENGITIGENQTYKAYMWSCYLDKEELIPEADGGEKLSADYVPTDIEEYLCPGDSTDEETFDYYGKSVLTDCSKYVFGGSAGHDLTLGSDNDGTTYTRIMSDGAKNGSSGQGSFYIMRPFENLTNGTGSNARIMIDVDLKYISGGGLNFGFARNTTPNKSPFVDGSEGLTAFTVANEGKLMAGGQEIGAISGNSWTNVKYILDMATGTAEVSVGGGTPVTVDVPKYQTFGTPGLDTLKNLVIEGQKVAFDVYASNMTVAKLTDGTEQTSITLDSKLDGTGGASNTITITEQTLPEKVAVVLAQYNDNNSLRSTEVIDKEITEATKTFDVSVPANGKVMVWDGLDTMKPVAFTNEQIYMDYGDVSITGADENELTVVAGSTVKVSATPKDGFVFVKWIDEEGNTISTNANADIRLYQDAAITGVFAVQGSVEDLVSFKASANKTSVKTGVEQNIELLVSEVNDAEGNPIKYSESDVVWTCEDTGVTVSGNTLTIPATYTISGLTKDLTVKCTIGSVSRNVVITLYGYEYYEEINADTSNVTGDYATKFMTIAGKTAMVFPSADNTTSYRMSEPVNLDGETTFTFENVYSGSNTCGQKRTLNFVNSSGATIFSVYYSWASLYVGSAQFENAIAKDSWKKVTAVINPTSKTVTISVDGLTVKDSTDTTATIALADNAGDIAGIDLVSAGSVPGPDQRSLGLSSIIITK